MIQHCKVLAVAAIVVVVSSVTALGEGTLVAHYEFEDADDLGKDSSGMGNHADDVFEVEQVDGQFGQGAFFDEFLGSTFIKYDGLDGLTGKPGITLAAWVSLDPATSGYDGIISQDGGGCCEHRILLHPNQQPFINLSEHDDRHLTEAPFFEFEEWMHIAMTGLDDEDGGFAEARVYVNGEEVDDSPQEFPEMDDASTWNTYLGAGESGNVHFLTGALDDVRIYEGALTEKEIQEIMGGTVGIDGDYNEDGTLDALDIDLQSAEMKKDPADQDLAKFDHNNDGVIDVGTPGSDNTQWGDRLIWIRDFQETSVGDSNLDGVFDSGDLVLVFAGGAYETGDTAGWALGDWDGDMVFGSGDLVFAFSDGGYVAGAAPVAVPEPSACGLLLIGFLFIRLSVGRGRPVSCNPR